MEPISCSILTISDRSSLGQREDLSGPALHKYVESLGWNVLSTCIIPDEIEIIQKTLLSTINDTSPDIVLTTGGTGCAPRDVTPEATKTVISKEIPGLSEVMRLESSKINPHALLSRGISGIYLSSIIINLPGNPKAAVENLSFVEKVLSHAVALLRSDSNAEKGHQIFH
jgi:molybdenum cofactor synthesis domain-containing protein